MRTFWAAGIRAEKNRTLGFVKAFTPQPGDKIRLAAMAVYRFYANGELAGYGPARTCHGYARIDEYDLSRYAGKKVFLVFEVLSANINNFYVMGELPYFACEIIRDGRVIAEAGDFDAYLLTDRVQKVQKFSFQRAFVESYRMKQDRTAFYRGETSLFPSVRLEEVPQPQFLERGVPYATFPYSPCLELVEGGTFVYDPSLPLYQNRALNQIGEKQRGFTYEELEDRLSDAVCRFVYTATDKKSKNLSGGEYLTVDFGRTHTGFIALDLTVSEDAELYLSFDEVITQKEKWRQVNPFRNDSAAIIKYAMAPGEYHLLAYEPYSLRFMTLSLKSGSVSFKDIGIVDYENPEIMAYEPHFDGGEIDEIVRAARNTLAQNAVDLYTDCPCRERAGWLCDSYFSARAEPFFTGKSEVDRNFIENYLLSPQQKELPEGMLPMCYPSEHADGVFIPQWSMWFVLEFYNYVQRTGDRSLFEIGKKRIYKLLDYFVNFENELGLLENLESWSFIEWSMCNQPGFIDGVNFPSNMLYSETLRAVGLLFKDEVLLDKAARIVEQIEKYSFNGTYYEENLLRDENGKLYSPHHLTETCQYYAFYFGIATRDKHPDLARLMVEEYGPTRNPKTQHPDVHPSNAFIGNALRFEVLMSLGEYERVMRDGHDYLIPMARMTGTLWENNSIFGSLNHGFAAYAAVFMTDAFQKLNGQ